MKEITYLIIGGGIAGTSAAEVIRQHDRASTIAIVSDEPYPLYSRIALSKPNFFLGKLPFDSVWLKSLKWYKEASIETLFGRKAIRLNPKEKKITLDDGGIIRYQRLLIATGGTARRYENPNIDPSDIVYLRTLDDAKAIIEETKHAKKGLVLGGGFIGFEMADMMRQAGMDVTIAIRESRYWETILDTEGSTIIANAFAKYTIRFLKNIAFRLIEKNTSKTAVCSDGTRIEADIVVAGIGISCIMPWMQEAGLKTEEGIVVNEYLETNIPDVWAAGDVAAFYDQILEKRVQCGIWVNAQMQGRAAGVNMVDQKNKKPFLLISAYTTSGLGLKIAFVGDVRVGSSDRELFRVSPNHDSYGKFVVRNGSIVGGVLINRTHELSAITKLITQKISITGKEALLKDAQVPLQNFIS